MADEFAVVETHTGKRVKVPRVLFENKNILSMRAYAVESGQATWDEVNPPNARMGQGFGPESGMGVLENTMVSAGRAIKEGGSNLRQLFNELMGNDDAAQIEKNNQAEIARLAAPAKKEFPVSSIVGESLPYFAVPGGKAAQVGAGVIDGALRGDTTAERVGGGVLGGTLSLAGSVAGDKLGSRFQNFVQSKRGNPNASARAALLDANVPLSLSQRTDGPISKPMARFFERGRTVWTGNQPKGAAQQARMTELVTEALGVKGGKLTREVLGDAVKRNNAVFKTAARRVGGPLWPDDELQKRGPKIAEQFRRRSTDSRQARDTMQRYADYVSDPDGISAKDFLELREDLSALSSKPDMGREVETIWEAINSLDDNLARAVPDLADDLQLARDRFRLLLALRRGAALSPQGDINLPTFTKSLERIFNDFDANVPLPRSLGQAGEAIAGLNQVVEPFRSSGTAENMAAAALPGTAAFTDPSIVLRGLMGAAAPFAGGGAGSVLGGGVGRGVSDLLIDEAIQDRQ